MKYITLAGAFAVLGASALFGQTFDSSGNGMLKGAFHFRQLEAKNFDQNTGDVTETVALSGTITFDGAGNYTVTGSSVDNTVSGGAPQTVNASGTYSIGANGFGYVINPLDSSDYIYGGVGQGIFVASSTEGSVLNTLIAIPASPVLTNATFTGSYWAGDIDFAGGVTANLKNSLFEFTPNGQGGFGAMTFTGQAENQTNPTITQNVTGATYTFGTDGSVAMTVPLPSGVTSTNALFTGAKTMFVSADGNFVMGYTASGYDLFFGMKALSSAAANSTYKGLYYLSALEDGPGFNSACGNADGFYGSLISDGNGDQIIHERLAAPFCSTFDFETDDVTTFTNNGNASDFNGYNYAFGDSGQAFVAIGTGGFFSLIAGVHANTFTGSGVFLNPIGVTNSASFAPITASLAPGELVTLFGTGLSATTLTTQGGIPFPTTLGGVQVLVNGTPAPIYYVSPTQISAILPYSLSTATLASIQVKSNGATSNAVTQFTTDAIPGIFSQTANGLGYAAAVHAATGKLVTQANPAIAGEYIALFLTGLGTVTPAITDGAIGPTNPLSYADQFNSNNMGVFFDDYNNNSFPQANVNYAGLAPGLAGLYQINVQVPTGVGPGDVYLEVFTDYADVNQIQVPVGSGTSAAARVPAGPVRMHRRPMATRKRAVKGSLRNQAVERSQFPR